MVPRQGKWSGRKESNFRRQLGSCCSTIELRLHVASALWHSWRLSPIDLLRVSPNEQVLDYEVLPSLGPLPDWLRSSVRNTVPTSTARCALSRSTSTPCEASFMSPRD